MASDSVTAAGALLWLTHALLREKGWALRPAAAQPFSTQRQPSAVFSSFAGDVSLLPAVRFGLPSAASARRDEGIAHDDDDDVDVHVRALVVGDKLFVHFVSRRKSARVSLTVNEYVKPRGVQAQQGQEAPGRVLDAGKWRCNLETLRWRHVSVFLSDGSGLSAAAGRVLGADCVLSTLAARLERNLFPEFSSDGEHEAQTVAADAELNRLPEPLLVRVGSFLHASEFCQVAQTSQYLHRLHDSPELWRQFLRHDYPAARPGVDPKAVYLAHWTRQKRMEAWVQQHRERRLNEYMLRLPMHWRWRVGGRRPAPPLYLPLAPPFFPFEQQPWLLPPPHPRDLFDDQDLELLPDPFASRLDPRLAPRLDPRFY